MPAGLADDDDREWDAALAAAPFVPLQQSRPYGLAAKRRGRRLARLVATRDGAPVAFVQAATRRIGPLDAITFAARGPVAIAPDPTALAGLMLGLRRPWPTLLLLAPELEAGATATATLRGARLRPVMTGSHVALVELGGDLRVRLGQKWRNRLVRAEAAGLRIEIARGGRHLDWLLAAHGRVMARKRFRGPPPEFVADAVAAADPVDVFVVAALRRSVPVAGALVLRHGRAATYWIAAAEPEGRQAQAGNLVLWRAMLALRDAGAATLDLGLVDTDRSPDLARFKLGTGAAVRTLCGTWTPCPV